MTQQQGLSDSDWQALTTYVFDVPNAEQIERVQALIDGPLGAQVMEELVALRGLGGVSPDRLDHQAAWQAVATQLTYKPESPAPARPQPKARFQRSFIGAVAACTALAAVVIGVQEYRGGRVVPGKAEATAYTITTRSAQRTEITLADGTQVFLNVASRLEVPNDFGVQQRKVILHGQAAFRVAHATNLPFSVQAAGTDIKVLGTEFGVRAYDAEQPVSVAVRSGRVGVGTAVLQAGDIGQARLGRSLRVMHQQNVDVAFDFTVGQMVLDKARLRDIIPDLNRWYDIEIRLGSVQLGDRRVSGTLKSGGIESLVEAFEEAFNLRVERHGRVVTLYENR